MTKVKNLIDTIWGSTRAHSRDFTIKTHNSSFAGVSWQNKTEILREHLVAHRCDAMVRIGVEHVWLLKLKILLSSFAILLSKFFQWISDATVSVVHSLSRKLIFPYIFQVVTSLTEIAYLLNLRGGDFRYLPVFRAYLIVSLNEAILYTNRTKVSLEAETMLNFDFKTNSCFRENCVMWVMNSNYELSQYSINEWKSHPLAHDCFQFRPSSYLFPRLHRSIKDYNDVWKDLRTLSHRWKRVLLPSLSVFDMGASEAIHSSLNREIISERASPIITMRAQKNEVEREGMRRAHVKDAVAMCETLSYLEERVSRSTHYYR